MATENYTHLRTGRDKEGNTIMWWCSISEKGRPVKGRPIRMVRILASTGERQVWKDGKWRDAYESSDTV